MSNDRVVRGPDLADAIARSVADILRPHLATVSETAPQQVADNQGGRFVRPHSRAHGSVDAPIEDLAIFDLLSAQARSALARHDLIGVIHSLRALTARFAVPVSLPHAAAASTRDQGLKAGVAGECVADFVRRGDGATLSQAAKATDQGASFSVVAAEYLRLRATDREGGMRGQTINQNKATFRMFVEVNGDLPFTAIGRKHASAFLSVLEQLPAHYAKSPTWRGMTLEQIAAAPKPKGTAMLTKKTQGRHFAALGGLFKHLISRNGYAGANPALGFGLKPKRRSRNERPAWTPEDLARLFESPIWMGCLSERRRSTTGKSIYRNAMYWLPILCVFHGARLEEFAQLRRRDVRQEGDIWYFNVTDEAGGQLKNEQSRRQVPLHPFVIEIGFLHWLGDPAKESDTLVFTELTPSGADGKFGPAITKKFCRYRRQLKLATDDTVFHSLRHSVVTALIRAGAQQVLRREVTGHKQQGEDEGRYFKGADMRGLLQTVSLVRWPEAESVLRTASARFCALRRHQRII